MRDLSEERVTLTMRVRVQTLERESERASDPDYGVEEEEHSSANGGTLVKK